MSTRSPRDDPMICADLVLFQLPESSVHDDLSFEQQRSIAPSRAASSDQSGSSAPPHSLAISSVSDCCRGSSKRDESTLGFADHDGRRSRWMTSLPAADLSSNIHAAAAYRSRLLHAYGLRGRLDRVAPRADRTTIQLSNASVAAHTSIRMVSFGTFAHLQPSR